MYSVLTKMRCKEQNWMQGQHNGKMVDLFNWPNFRLTKSVFFRARAVNRGTHVYPRMSKGYLQPLVIIIFIFFIFGVTFVHANLCLHILASTCQDGGNPFPVIRLPVVNCVTDSSRHTLLQPALHSQWSRQVYIGHRSITGFLVVQEPTCTHAHEYRLLGASCCFYFWCHICACKFMHAYFSFDLSRWRQSISGYYTSGCKQRD